LSVLVTHSSTVAVLGFTSRVIMIAAKAAAKMGNGTIGDMSLML
jgi:hypothetical protein